MTSAQIVNANDRLYMLDCGEGAQVKLQEYHIKRNKIKAIFITHLHGDHIFGLHGLLTSYLHSQRHEPIYIFGPKGIREYVETVQRLTASYILFDIVIHEINPANPVIYTDDAVIVTAFPLEHRIETYGYLIQETKKYNIDPESIEKYKLKHKEIQLLKAGKSVRTGKDELSPEDCLIQRHPPRSYAYCTDTKYTESILPIIQGVNALYHESTYLSDMVEMAGKRMHSTAVDAATIARKAGVGQLILGHYSTRYTSLKPFLTEAQAIFPHVILGKSGLEVEI